MVSAVDSAKRALASLLKTLAGIYGVVVGVTRDSSDAEVVTACWKVSRQAHPNHAGNLEHQEQAIERFKATIWMII